MASLDRYNTLSNQIKDLVSNYSIKRDQTVADTKKQYGYDDRIKSLESLKKTSLDTERILRSLPTDINNRLTGRRMTSAQRNRVFAKEQAPIAQQLADVGLGVQAEQEGINLIRNLINDALGLTREDFTNNANMLSREQDNAWNQYTLDDANEQRRIDREFTANQNALNRMSQERASSANYDPIMQLLKELEEKKKPTATSAASKAISALTSVITSMGKAQAKPTVRSISAPTGRGLTFF